MSSGMWAYHADVLGAEAGTAVPCIEWRHGVERDGQ